MLFERARAVGRPEVAARSSEGIRDGELSEGLGLGKYQRRKEQRNAAKNDATSHQNFFHSCCLTRSGSLLSFFSTSLPETVDYLLPRRSFSSARPEVVEGRASREISAQSPRINVPSSFDSNPLAVAL